MRFFFVVSVVALGLLTFAPMNSFAARPPEFALLERGDFTGYTNAMILRQRLDQARQDGYRSAQLAAIQSTQAQLVKAVYMLGISSVLCILILAINISMQVHRTNNTKLNGPLSASGP